MWQSLICGSGLLIKHTFCFRTVINCVVGLRTVLPEKIFLNDTVVHKAHLRRLTHLVPILPQSQFVQSRRSYIVGSSRWKSSSSNVPSDDGVTIDLGAKVEAPLDVDKELLRYDYEEFELKSDEEPVIVETQEPVVFERGTTGVFDLEELITVLNEENARDVCAISVPSELRYVDYLVIATGRSTRHIKAMAEYIRWAYKQKRGMSDAESVKIEGELSKDWLALDLGNIAVHLFLKETRRKYDLEQLWTVGPEFDDKSRETSAEANPGAFSLEGFSFDVELEKFRQLRNEQSVPSADSTNINKQQRSHRVVKDTETEVGLTSENVATASSSSSSRL